MSLSSLSICSFSSPPLNYSASKTDVIYSPPHVYRKEYRNLSILNSWSHFSAHAMYPHHQYLQPILDCHIISLANKFCETMSSIISFFPLKSVTSVPALLCSINQIVRTGPHVAYYSSPRTAHCYICSWIKIIVALMFQFLMSYYDAQYRWR
jgi:hypothetical protein